MTHYAPLIAALVTMLLTAILVFGKVGKQIQDHPNERSLHDEPVPRIGGVALMAGMLSAWALMLKTLQWWVVLPMLGLFVVSLLDDVRGLQVRTRLIAHIVAAALLALGSGILAQNILVGILVLLGTVWMTNLFNFMDGSDGLAGGMALFGFSMYGVAALMHGDETQAMLNFSIGAAALGFLYYNFNPAKVFMGDAGSIPLGFLVAGMGAWGWQRGHWPAWFPLLVFLPFIADASVTLLRRMLCRQKFWEAHRDHYYQRLVQMGWGHRNVALFGYVLMFASGVSALWSIRNFNSTPWPVFLIWAGIYIVFIGLLEWRWKLFQKGVHV